MSDIAAKPVRRPLWRRLLRWAVWLFAGLLGLIALLLAVLVAINWQDEALMPKTQAWLAVPPNPVADADNAWLAMIAVGVEKQPGTAVGRQMLESLRQNPRILETSEALTRFGPEWKTDKLDTGFCNLRREGSGLLGRIEARAKELRPVLQANQAALARYDAATRLPGFFEEEQRNPAATLPLGDASKAGCLARSELAPRLLHGEREAEARFVRHAHYWLSALRQSHSLIGAMIANAQVEADVDLLRGLAERNPALGARLRQALLPDLQALAHADIQTLHERLLAGELRFIRATLASDLAQVGVPWYDRWELRLFYQPQASLNFQQSLMTHPDEFKTRCDMYQWHYAYNPIGKILSCIGAPSYQSYFDRIRMTQYAAAKLLVADNTSGKCPSGLLISEC